MEFEIYFDLYYLKYDIPKWISRLLLHFALNRNLEKQEWQFLRKNESNKLRFK